MSEAASPIDRAKAIVNDRILALGLNDTFQSYAPVYTGLPITHDEGQYLIEVLERDLAKQLERGVPLHNAMGGALNWAFLVGLFAGQGSEATP